jgi:hypothetical protein
MPRPGRRATVAGLALGAVFAAVSCDSNKGLDPSTSLPAESSSASGSSSVATSDTPTAATSSTRKSTASSPTSKPPASSPSPKSTSPAAIPKLTAAQVAAIKTGYRAYLTVTAKATHEPRSVWKKKISEVAVDEALISALANLGTLRDHDAYTYGKILPHFIGVEALSVDRVRVRDCQDSSSAGLQHSDGQKINVGKPKVYVVATMRLDKNVWKYSQADIQGNRC